MRLVECTWTGCKKNWDGQYCKEKGCEFKRRPEKFNQEIWKLTEYVVALSNNGLPVIEAIKRVSNRLGQVF